MRMWLVLSLLLAGCAGRGSGPRETERGVKLMVFVLSDCPISNGYAPEIQRIGKDYSGRVGTSVVFVDEGRDEAELKRHGQEYGYTLPVLVDGKREMVKRYGVDVAPQAVVVDAGGQVVYQGRIDDRYEDFGKQRKEPTRRDVREALDAVLAGKRVELARTKAIGCSL